MMTACLRDALGLALLLQVLSATAFVGFSRTSTAFMPPTTDQWVLFDSSSPLPSIVNEEESVGKDTAKFSKVVRKSNTPPEGAIAMPKTETSESKREPSRGGGAAAAASGDMLDSKLWLKNLLKDEGVVLGWKSTEEPVTTADEVSDVQKQANEALATKGEWSAFFDAKNTGLIYYFNSFTGESQWKPPLFFPMVTLTREMKKISQQRQEEYLETRRLEQMEEKRSIAASMQVTQAPLASAGSWGAFWDRENTGYVYYHNTETGMSQWTPPEFFPKFKLGEGMKVVKPELQDGKLATEGDWSAYFDKEIALVYYFNRLTGESQWEKPTALFPPVQLTESMQEAVNVKVDLLKRKHRGPLRGLFGSIFGRNSHELRHKNPVVNWFLNHFAPEIEEEPKAAPAATLWDSMVHWFEERLAFWDGLVNEPKGGLH